MQVFLFKDSLYADDNIEIRSVNEDIACLFYDPHLGKQYLWGAKTIKDAQLRKVYPFQSRFVNLPTDWPLDKKFIGQYWKEYAIAIVYESDTTFQVKRINFKFSPLQAVDFSPEHINIVSRVFNGSFIDLTFSFNSLIV